MKKLSVFYLIMILAFTVGMFVSCSNETKVDDATATVSFGRADTSRALSSSVGIPGANELYWSVTATKNDTGLASGAGTYNLNGNGVKGISNDVRLTLSVGSWSFTLEGYTDSDRNPSSRIYEGTTVETLYKNDSKVINVDVRYCGTTNGYGTVQLDGVLLSNASSVAGKLKVEVLTATTPYPTSIFTISENKTFSGMIRNGDGNPVQITPGVYQVRFTLMNGDNAVLNPLVRYVVVLQGRNTVISGDIAEEQASISFKVNILADSYAQFGNYFYVLVDTEEGYQKALEAAAAYTGEGTPIIILSRNLEVDGTTITAAASRAINIGMRTSGIVIDLNGNELKLKSNSTVPVLLKLDAEDKTVTIMDSSSNGEVSAAGNTAIEVVNGKVEMLGGTINAATAIKLSSATASASVKGGTLAATEKVIDLGISARLENVDLSGAKIDSSASVLGFASGTGSASDPFIINSVNTFKAFADNVNKGITFADQYIKLTADIDLNHEAWTPIGGGKKSAYEKYSANNIYKTTVDDYYVFAGTFDGDNHTISNVDISCESTDNLITCGLFGAVSNGAVIRNLKLKNVNVGGRFFVGSLIGYVPAEFTAPADDYTLVENITVTGNLSVKGYASVGGIIGRSEVRTLLKVDNCTINVSDISKVETVSDGFMIGGVVGVAYGQDTIINSCSTNVDVKGKIQTVGGIVGHLQDGTITESNVSGDVVLEGKNTSWPYDHYGVGAIVGTVDSSVKSGTGNEPPALKSNSILIKNCTATGNVTAEVNDNEPLFFNGLVGTIRSTATNSTYQGVNPRNIVTVIIDKDISSQSEFEKFAVNTHNADDKFPRAAQAITLNLMTDVKLDVSDAYFTFGGDDTNTVTINGNGNRFDLTSTYWSRLSLKNPYGKLIIRNTKMNSDQNQNTWNSYDITFVNIKDLELTDVKFEKSVAIDNCKNAKLGRVSIIEAAHPYYALWITAGSGVTITDSEIRGPYSVGDSLGRAIKISDEYVGRSSEPYGVGKTTLSVSNTVMEGAKKSAILVGTIGGADITVTNCTAIVGDQWNTDAYRFVTIDNGTTTRGKYSDFIEGKINITIDDVQTTPTVEP